MTNFNSGSSTGDGVKTSGDTFAITGQYDSDDLLFLLLNRTSHELIINQKHDPLGSDTSYGVGIDSTPEGDFIIAGYSNFDSGNNNLNLLTKFRKDGVSDCEPRSSVSFTPVDITWLVTYGDASITIYVVNDVAHDVLSDPNLYLVDYPVSHFPSYECLQTESPTASPTASPTSLTQTPSISPTKNPTGSPSLETEEPTEIPTQTPSINPTQNPTGSPSLQTIDPSQTPTNSPSLQTIDPSQTPTNSPSLQTIDPSQTPTNSPSLQTIDPSQTPTNSPSLQDN